MCDECVVSGETNTYSDTTTTTCSRQALNHHLQTVRPQRKLKNYLLDVLLVTIRKSAASLPPESNIWHTETNWWHWCPQPSESQRLLCSEHNLFSVFRTFRTGIGLREQKRTCINKLVARWWGSGGMPQLADSLPSRGEALGAMPMNQLWWCLPAIPESGRQSRGPEVQGRLGLIELVGQLRRHKTLSQNNNNLL